MMPEYTDNTSEPHELKEKPTLNEHNKQEYPPMHTAEHLLNGEMARRYGCGRAFSAHVERTKSKLDYHLPRPLTEAEVQQLEDYVNTVVARDVPVTEAYITQAEAMSRFDMTRLPEGASDTVRVVIIGDYDECLCAGTHVRSTARIGHFRISSTRFQNGVQRIVFKLEGEQA
jgi:alanyl-tRNA synthetase